jgi:hypothetical protein
MSLQAFTVAAAAAVSPAQPVTQQEIAANLSPEARVVAMEHAPKAPPLENLEQDPQGQQQSAAAAKVAPELTLEQKHAVSVALQQLKALDEMVYKRIVGGEPAEQVLKDARAQLQLSLEKGEITLSSLERALKDPEGFAASQKSARDRIDKKMAEGFNIREDVYGGKSGWEAKITRLKGGDSAAKLDLCDSLREALMLRKDEAGVLHNAMPSPYLSDPTLKGALTVTPLSAATKGMSAEERKSLTVLTSPNDPSKPLQPEEVRSLTDSEKAARFERVRPVEGKDPGPQFKEARNNSLAKLNEEQTEALFAVEKLAREVAQQTIVLEERGLPLGIEYHVAVDRSNSARGAWQGIDNYGTRGGDMAYRGSIQLRDAVRPHIPKRADDIPVSIANLRELGKSKE